MGVARRFRHEQMLHDDQIAALQRLHGVAKKRRADRIIPPKPKRLQRLCARRRQRERPQPTPGVAGTFAPQRPSRAARATGLLTA